MKKSAKKIAYHFVGKKLRDGRPVPKDGVWLEEAGRIAMCARGLHYGHDPFDALQYAPGPILCMVEVDDIVHEESDKGVCRRRKIIKRFDATDILRYFARMQALSVIHLWDAPDVVLDFLMTGENAAHAADAAYAAYAAADAAANAAYAAADAAAYATARKEARIEFNSLVNAEFESME